MSNELRVVYEGGYDNELRSALEVALDKLGYKFYSTGRSRRGGKKESNLVFRRESKSPMARRSQEVDKVQVVHNGDFDRELTKALHAPLSKLGYELVGSEHGDTNEGVQTELAFRRERREDKLFAVATSCVRGEDVRVAATYALAHNEWKATCAASRINRETFPLDAGWHDHQEDVTEIPELAWRLTDKEEAR